MYNNNIMATDEIVFYSLRYFARFLHDEADLYGQSRYNIGT